MFDPEFRRGPPLPAAVDPGAVYGALHPERRATGSYYTPAAIVDFVVSQSWNREGSVGDPACGGGAFLVGALRALPAAQRREFAVNRLFGRDLDPLAVMVAQAAIADFARLDTADCVRLQRHVRVGNSLLEPPLRVETVLTNPPFLNRLRGLTARDEQVASAVRARHGSRVGPYTDVSVAFLLDALAGSRGSVGIVMPASVCAVRDAAAAREAAGTPAWFWTLPRGSIAGVEVPLIAMGFAANSEKISRFAYLPPEPLSPAGAGAPWNSLLFLPDQPPWAPDSAPGGHLGEIGTVEADFRDEYYALAGHVEEDGPGLRVVTSGQIGVGVSHWGTRASRIHKQSWLRPTVRPQHLHPRQAARTRPRLLVATQTGVLEVAPDPGARCVGLTPVLTVTPNPGRSLAEILACMLAPPASAWAHRESAGSALALGSVKLSASQLRELPLPSEVPAVALALADRVLAGDGSAVPALARAMNTAWNAPDSCFDWWAQRGGVGDSRFPPA